MCVLFQGNWLLQIVSAERESATISALKEVAVVARERGGVRKLRLRNSAHLGIFPSLIRMSALDFDAIASLISPTWNARSPSEAFPAGDSPKMPSELQCGAPSDSYQRESCSRPSSGLHVPFSYHTEDILSCAGDLDQVTGEYTSADHWTETVVPARISEFGAFPKPSVVEGKRNRRVRLEARRELLRRRQKKGEFKANKRRAVGVQQKDHAKPVPSANKRVGQQSALNYESLAPNMDVHNRLRLMTDHCHLLSLRIEFMLQQYVQLQAKLDRKQCSCPAELTKSPINGQVFASGQELEESPTNLLAVQSGMLLETGSSSAPDIGLIDNAFMR